MYRRTDRSDKIKKGLLAKADKILSDLESSYEIDGEKAGNYIFTVTESLSEWAGASFWDRWRSKKTYRVSFANRLAATKTNYEKFRPAEDALALKFAQELIDAFNTGWANEIIRRLRYLDDRDIRALILSDMLRRTREGQRILTAPRQYAELLSVSDEVASFDLQYLLDRGLVQGEAISVSGTTDKFVNVHGITSRGIDAVEGRGTGQFEINFRTINVNASVTGQMAVGDNVVQNQLGSVSNFQDLYRFVQGSLSQQQSGQLMPLLKELEEQANRDLVKPSTIKRVADLVSTYGPSAALIMDTIGRLLGLGH